MDSSFSDIRDLRLFADMSDDSYSALMRGAYVQTFPPHLKLISEGDQSDFLHVLVSGVVELFASWDGRETSMVMVKPVSAFILAATVRDERYLMSAKTVEKSKIVLIPSQDVRKIFDLDAGFARSVVVELAASYRLMVKTSKNLKLRSSMERLANYLLCRCHENGNGESFDLGLGKRQLAAFLGMTPENLSRNIKGLKPHGVTIFGDLVVISSISKLEKFAKPDVLIDGN
ncbi:cyclic nucleotide-binding domain-containing protein [Thalassospira xiamenensis]|nr:cyclic nucleotide-binding domain-containing protein [Thalassospira xiamenensis]KZB56350.1 transcriptional regulator [Thalassospira xiamenensis]MCK2167208.1 helix-turn-helix domain-containing protein [Thalassospira xiamenensis]